MDTKTDHLQTARQIAKTINHVKPHLKGRVVAEWAEHIRAMLSLPQSTINGQGRLWK